ncbi:MAG: DUF4956 domain-containing protein [Clostridiales bacterium]|jgi:hypothetical protein|nr:DUF4956 domain-containing protein [Clostridiales bacterium]
MFDSIFTTVSESSDFTLENLLLALGVALVLGILISTVYMKTHKSGAPSQSFSITLVLLPAIITIIIMLVGNSVARAFSLAGAFSIIRFRSAPGDPKDITYVLFTMAAGLSCGMGFPLYGIIMAVILCGVTILLETFNFGKMKGEYKLLKITIPENLDYSNAFDDILQKYTSAYTRKKVRTTDLGSLYELQYSILARNDMSEKAFIDELRCRNGNLNISLVLDSSENEF